MKKILLSILLFLILTSTSIASFIGIPDDKWAHLYMGSTFVAGRQTMGVSKEQSIMELILFAIVKEVVVDGYIGGWKPDIRDFGTTMLGGILFQVAFK